jgi:DNA repair exonuclease SbcCD ATPase subunit
MYEQIQKLKKAVNDLSEERTQLRSKLIRFDSEITRKEKQMESLLQSKAATDMGAGGKFEQIRTENHVRARSRHPRHESHLGGVAMQLLKNLKTKVTQLERTIAQKDDEIGKLKSDSRFTRVAELELELRTYYNEVFLCWLSLSLSVLVHSMSLFVSVYLCLARSHSRSHSHAVCRNSWRPTELRQRAHAQTSTATSRSCRNATHN